MRSRIPVALALMSSALPAPAYAAWSKASSEHFLIYSEQSPERLRKFAEDLERFDGAARFLCHMNDLPLSQGNRLTIFVLRNEADVQRIIGDKSGLVAGFYRGKAEASVAYTSEGEASNAARLSDIGSNIRTESLNTNLGGQTILLHEYSHHLMMQDLRVPYPAWLVEGFAEFMSTATFEKDAVGIGLPASHRANAFNYGPNMRVETLLSSKSTKMSNVDVEVFYARSWLLTHYLIFEPSRKGQLRAYLAALSKGTDPLQAARDSFGDLGKLNGDLDDYLSRSRLAFVKISGNALNFAPVEVTKLGSGGSAAVPLLAELMNGVPEKDARTVAQKIAVIEQADPGDQLVETALAEAQLEAKDLDAAEAAADRALKTNSRNTDAIVLKGRVVEARAEQASAPARARLFQQARDLFIAANSIDSEDPEPLMNFYEAFVREGLSPTPNAIAALHYASDLAPQDGGLRMTSAAAYLQEGKLSEAKAALVPIAYDPHGGDTAELARKMVERIDAGDAKGAIAVEVAGAKQPSRD